MGVRRAGRVRGGEGLDWTGITYPLLPESTQNRVRRELVLNTYPLLPAGEEGRAVGRWAVIGFVFRGVGGLDPFKTGWGSEGEGVERVGRARWAVGVGLSLDSYYHLSPPARIQ